MSVGYALPQGSYWNSPAPEAMAFQAASAAPGTLSSNLFICVTSIECSIAYAVAATAPTPHASRDLTLQRISEAADKDVEMQVHNFRAFASYTGMNTVSTGCLRLSNHLRRTGYQHIDPFLRRFEAVQ